MDKKAKKIEAKHLAGLKKAIASQIPQKGEKQRLKIAPSKARILNMSYPILIEHYALVQHKRSSLSAIQRKYVENRVKYLQDKSIISQAEIDLAMIHIENLINKEPEKV